MINVQPGPSQLFHSVRDHVRQALKLRIPELSPATNEARELVQYTARQLRELLAIPDTHHIIFLPETSSLIDDNETQLLSRHHTDEGGTSLDADLLTSLRRNNVDKLIALNVSLAWPHASIPFELVDTVYLDFHFGFGLPAGLGAAVANDRWIERHQRTQRFFEALHPALNLTWVSVLSGVVGDMLSRGIPTIRRETEYKATLLYHMLDQHPVLQPAIAQKAVRSRTVIAIRANDVRQVEAELRKHAISAGFRGDLMILANFPSHSKEQYERLTDILSAIR